MPCTACGAADAQRVQRQCQRCHQAVIDTDGPDDTGPASRYIHGVILDGIASRFFLPVLWNGKVVIHTRGFSGTEFNTGAFLPAALAKGYAFAATDERDGSFASRSRTSRKIHVLRIAPAPRRDSHST